MRSIFATLVASGLVSASCAIRPIPHDVTGLSTYAIAIGIACEARDAIRMIAANTISRTDRDLADQLRADSPLFLNLDLKSLHPQTRKILQRYDQAVLVLDFTFEITANNNTEFGVSLGQTLVRGPLSIGFGHKNKRERKNTDEFRTLATFGYLATRMPERYCHEVRTGSDQFYPIAGKIGMYELISQFLSLNQSANLIGSKDTPTIPTKVTTVEFTTEIGGSITPAVELSALGTLDLTKASVSKELNRKDVHRVIVSMTLPSDPNDGRTDMSIAEQRAAAEAAERVRAREERKEEFRVLGRELLN